jgi:proteic killer suppression protein
VIRAFRDKGLEDLFRTGTSRRIPVAMRKKIERRLDVLDAASGPNGVDVPGFGLHPLKGKRAGEWSIRVTGNYRITFRFEDGDVLDVDLEDYH